MLLVVQPAPAFGSAPPAFGAPAAGAPAFAVPAFGASPGATGARSKSGKKKGH